MTNTERQAEFRRSMKAQGLVAVTVWVHRDQAAQLAINARMMRAEPALSAGPLIDQRTGRLVSTKR